MLAVELVVLFVGLLVLAVGLLVLAVGLLVLAVGLLALVVIVDVANTMTAFGLSVVAAASAFDIALLLVGRLVGHNKRFLDLAMM